MSESKVLKKRTVPDTLAADLNTGTLLIKYNIVTYYGTDLEHVTRQTYDQKVKEVRLAQFTEDQIPEISDELLQQYSSIISR